MAADVLAPPAGPSTAVPAVARTTRVMSCRANVVVVGEPSMSSQQLDGLADPRSPASTSSSSGGVASSPTSEVSLLNAAGGAALQVSDDTIRLVDGARAVLARHAGSVRPDADRRAGRARLRAEPRRCRAAHLAGTVGAACAVGPISCSSTPRPRSSSCQRAPRSTRAASARASPPTSSPPSCSRRALAAPSSRSAATSGSAATAPPPPAGPSRSTRPDDPRRRTTIVSLADGGVATSTSRLRTWTSGGEHRHHLIDPATLRPSATRRRVVHRDRRLRSLGRGLHQGRVRRRPPIGGANGSRRSGSPRRSPPSPTADSPGERLTSSAWKAFER